MLLPVALGIVATLAAAAAVAAWIGIGSSLIRGVNRENASFLPASIVVGAAATSTVLAAASWLGLVREGAIVVTAIALVAIIIRRGVLAFQVGHAAGVLRDAVRDWRAGRWLITAAAVIAWVYAIAPPRDGDVMRYHLAHIRQIISDGAWQPIADITYALPFAWSLNYLPFELVGLPQAAHIVNLALGLVVAVTLLRIGPASLDPRTRLAVMLLFLAHPFMIRVFSSALADGYAILVTTVIVAALPQLNSADRQAAMLLGFCAWIGIGSRYQLVAVGLAVTAIVMFHSVRQGTIRTLAGFALGSSVAIILASPFYIANYSAFGNPFWPLMIPPADAASSYANEVASTFMAGYASSPGAGFRLANAVELVTTPDMAPMPALILLLCMAMLWSRERAARYVASFTAIFLVLWEIMSPRLYPTHILPLIPAGPVLLASLVATARWNVKRFAHRAIVLAAAGMITVSAFLAGDYARYALTGDAADFHRFTWYYSTYRWSNRNTPPSARFIVVALSGHSYYLDRRYRRADPWLSGEVDWRHLTSPADLDSVMTRGGYEYMIFDDRNWGLFPGGAQMGRVVREAMADGTLTPVHHSRELLYTSRARRKASRASVYVLRRSGG